ncbi:MAG: SIMPL domain-containing protein [Methanobrevibacter sp.]|nr:SIMPL domain-containing protein [Methanobrevibacter sp.]
MSERVISVRGNGKLELSPNLTVVGFDMEVKSKEYKHAYMKYKHGLKCLNSVINSLGFKKTDLKTKNWVAESINDYEDKFVGGSQKYKQIRVTKYRIYHSLKLEFDINSEMLSNLLSEMSKYELPLKIRINYEIKEKEEVKNELLKKAMIDAKNKAKIMIEALGEELGELREINHNVSNYSHGFMGDSYTLQSNKVSFDSYISDFEPEDLKFYDYVDLIWEIK